MIPSFHACQIVALARHAATGTPHCIVGDALTGRARILPEDQVVSDGLVDAILWSSDVSDSDAIDPALRA